MTGTERIMMTLGGQKADRVPTMLHAFMPAAAEAGLSMAEYRSSAKNIARAHIDFVHKYGLDGILPDVDTCLLAGAVGTKIDLPEHEPARPVGPASTNIKELLELMDPARVAKDERIKILVEAIHLMRKEVGGEILIRGHCDQMAFSLTMIAYGMQRFLMDLTDEDLEEDILALLERAYLVHLEFQKMMMDAGADITGFGDSSSGPALISRAMFKKFALPFHKKLQAELARRNILTVCHICGNVDIIAEDMADIGYAAVEIDQKTDIARAAEVFRGKSVVFGPIDPSGMFFFGTPAKMAAEVRRVLDFFHGKGIVLGAGCAIPSGAPEANIRAFVEAARAYSL
ncbi:uroporphyrinogen decarboxylase [Spirochaetia bacterium]|nr:uroporphyrinogen decarboxylase [Spirochaetia bacterium]